MQRDSTWSVVLIDVIVPDSVTYFEELLFDVDPSTDLHVLLGSPGGDGETAVRLTRSAQARCKKLTVLMPDQAKSAATLLAMGAHHILMGPASDLGPVDAQLLIRGSGFVAAKDLIASLDDAELAISKNPATFPLYASLFVDMTAVMVQQARAALGRSGDLIREALASNPDRDSECVEALAEALQNPLVDAPKDHRQVFGPDAAGEAGLPVADVDLQGDQWKMIWRLWTSYWQFRGNEGVYEGTKVSQLVDREG